MNKQILEIEIKRYMTISIKKLFQVNKEKIGVIDIEQNKIRNNINNLQSDGLEYSEEIEKLNKKFLDLELQKPNIDWDTLSYKCTQQMKDRYKEFNLNEIIKIVEKTKNIFKKNNYSLQSFKLYKQKTNKKYYKNNKEKKGIDTMTYKENALNTAAKKREKSINLIKEVLEILIKNGMKTTSNNVYQTIKNDFNDCLKERQIKTYLKELKEKNKGVKGVFIPFCLQKQSL